MRNFGCFFVKAAKNGDKTGRRGAVLQKTGR